MPTTSMCARVAGMSLAVTCSRLGAGEEMARKEDIRFLGAVPVNTELVALLDAANVDPLAEEGPEMPNWQRADLVWSSDIKDAIGHEI
jgi:hypothetical protein